MNDDIKKYIHQSVLCWLATSSADNIPNVSPKEIFAYFGDAIIIAHIASPQSVRNIKQNPNVCVSFIDILVQKGFQLKGRASILIKGDSGFLAMETELLKLTEGKFPFSEIIKIDITSSKPIIAPKYMLYPETTEAEQIESAKRVYGF
ncbi:pyridoxamine 5'-phosphate oxidase family protein [Hyunsoonleella sp. SJ7]|uniref:Pyridoxamine 5'-phosphate oxidase family protein n=1 Tax=Hyunsoonleella aquatilis TaxID=2762758 RepID=A0A923KLU1_9FLAO|nr:pyridoxamine 5'-phosphate oxidase family protein [Hyunsoonleella aquatilis]MBC3759817.1 pyridoxamine 5'-phosphate oxidase family protein [Hyunsoonleella aquatilis]